MTVGKIIRGKVVKGKNRGKKLGFPTANINLHKKIPEGIYLSIATTNKKHFNCLTFIGSAKTFGEKKVLAETYILSSNPNLYDKWLTVKLIKKIRENKKFESQKGLIAQMKKDKQVAEKYFKIKGNV